MAGQQPLEWRIEVQILVPQFDLMKSELNHSLIRAPDQAQINCAWFFYLNGTRTRITSMASRSFSKTTTLASSSILILLVAAWLRFWDLSHHPSGFAF